MTDEIQNSLGRIEQWQEDKGEKIDRIESAIYGDNGPGLKVKIDRNTRWRKTITWSIPVLIALGMLLVAVLK